MNIVYPLPFYHVALPMLVGPNSALKLKAEPTKLERLLTFVVDRKLSENTTLYDIAEMVVWAAIMQMEDREAQKKALEDFLTTPMVLEAFLLQGMLIPAPFPYSRIRTVPDRMDEHLLKQIPLTPFGDNGPVWDAESKEQVRNVVQRLWDQEWAYRKTEEYEKRMLSEYNRLLMESTDKEFQRKFRFWWELDDDDEDLLID